MLSLPAVSVLQRRNLILKNLIFYDNYAENGSGGAIAVRNRQESARVIITDCQFMRNSAFKGAGEAPLRTTAEVCEHNSKVASMLGCQIRTQAWSTLALILHRDVTTLEKSFVATNGKLNGTTGGGKGKEHQNNDGGHGKKTKDVMNTDNNKIFSFII